MPQFQFGNWYPIHTCPKKAGESYLLLIDRLLLDDDGERTAQIDGSMRYVGMWQGNSWEEPESLAFAPNAGFWVDDWEYADEPRLWSPLPLVPDEARSVLSTEGWK